MWELFCKRPMCFFYVAKTQIKIERNVVFDPQKLVIIQEEIHTCS